MLMNQLGQPVETWVITGAARGLGLELGRQVLEANKHARVIFLVQTLAMGKDAQDLIQASGIYHHLSIKVTVCSDEHDSRWTWRGH